MSLAPAGASAGLGREMGEERVTLLRAPVTGLREFVAGPRQAIRPEPLPRHCGAMQLLRCELPLAMSLAPLWPK